MKCGEERKAVDNTFGIRLAVEGGKHRFKIKKGTDDVIDSRGGLLPDAAVLVINNITLANTYKMARGESLDHDCEILSWNLETWLAAAGGEDDTKGQGSRLLCEMECRNAKAILMATRSSGGQLCMLYYAIWSITVSGLQHRSSPGTLIAVEYPSCVLHHIRHRHRGA